MGAGVVDSARVRGAASAVAPDLELGCALPPLGLALDPFEALCGADAGGGGGADGGAMPGCAWMLRGASDITLGSAG